MFARLALCLALFCAISSGALASLKERAMHPESYHAEVLKARNRYVLTHNIHDVNESPEFHEDNEFMMLARHHHENTPKDKNSLVQILVHVRRATKATRAHLTELVGETGHVGHYVPDNTYHVVTTLDTAHALRDDESVMWIGPYRSIDRLSPMLRDDQFLASLIEQREPLKLIVELNEKATTSVLESSRLCVQWTETLTRESVMQGRVDCAAHAQNRRLVSIDIDSLRPDERQKSIVFLSERSEVFWVEPNMEIEPHNKFTITVMQDNLLVGSTPFTDMGLDGSGEVLGAADSGIDWDNCYFSGSGQPPFSDADVPTVDESARKIIMYSTKWGDNYDQLNHGTHCAGTLMGNSVSGVSSPSAEQTDAAQYNGLAPEAKLAFVDIVGSNGTYNVGMDLTEVASMLHETGGANINLFAWGSDTPWYSTAARQIDEYSFNNPEFLAVFPTGNTGLDIATGGIQSPGTSKNGLTVGSTRSSKSSFLERLDQALMTQTANTWKNRLCNTEAPGLLWYDETFCTGIFRPTTPCYNGTQRADFCDSFSSNQCCTLPFFEPKCCLAVVTQNVRRNPGLYSPSVLSSWTGIGPTWEGRQKPDIVAPGERVFSAWSDGDTSTNNCGIYNNYPWAAGQLGGTSYAAATAAATASLVRQYYREQYADQTGNDAIDAPSSALIKATLVNGAVPATVEDSNGSGAFVGLDSVPSIEQGFGRPQLDQTLVGSESTPDLKLLAIDGAVVEDGDEPVRVCIQVTDSTYPLTATLAWTDPAGSVTSFVALVNNLDLVIVRDDGNEFRSNNLQQFDDVNNVERVQITNPESAVYSVTVFPRRVPEGPQSYALVISGGFSTGATCPSECPASCSLRGTCDGGVCQCDEEVGGVDCSIGVCAKNCNGNGVCDQSRGVCDCGPYFATPTKRPGDPCSLVLASAPNDFVNLVTQETFGAGVLAGLIIIAIIVPLILIYPVYRIVFSYASEKTRAEPQVPLLDDLDDEFSDEDIPDEFR